MKDRTLIIGLGETGGPIRKILEDHYDVVGLDIQPEKIDGDFSVVHICYPYSGDKFIDITKDYLERFSPEFAIINSTVQPGTTKKIYEAVNIPLAYSPIRGKHTRMQEDILHYTKFVAGTDEETAKKAMKHFEKAGVKTKAFTSPTSLELAKLMSTTYFGLLIAWAQEAERFCNRLGADYDEVMSFTDEISYFPPVIFQPGYITGHCVMPNIGILKDVVESEFLDTIEKSNEQKRQELLSKGESLDKRIAPKQKRK